MKAARISATLALTSLILGATAATPATAIAEFNVATVDVNRVLNESKDAIGRRKELQEMSNKAKAKIDAKRKPLQEMETKLKDKKISESSKEAEQFRVEARSFARFVKDTEEDLKKEYLRANKALTDSVLGEIRDYAKKKEIQMVLDKSELARGPVLFGSPRADITDDIIKALNN